METLFDELKRYVGFGDTDERALAALHPVAAPRLHAIADVFYARILHHEGARAALQNESQVGRLKVTLVAWLDRLLRGPWDEEYFALRCRIGRVHVRINLPQHYMFGAMNVVRLELERLVDEELGGAGDEPARLRARAREAIDRILDLELAIMLHAYREDAIAQQSRSERLSTFGQLVGSIGHELRNPLGVIESSLYILRQRVQADDERVQKHLGRIGEQLGVANGIISALLDMIRDRPLQREQVALDDLVNEVVSSAAPPPGVEVVLDGLGALPRVAADPRQLRQALLNLVENAVDALGGRGRLRVAGRIVVPPPSPAAPPEEAGAASATAATSAAAVELVVEDDGPGVAAEVHRRLFEPLVSTKAKGIGLGLALVKRIVENHGGYVVWDPRVERGARFVVRLPIAPPPTELPSRVG